MAFYVAAYDTEAIYPWWDLGDTPYSATTYQQVVSYEGARLDECLDGVRAVAEVHLRQQAPATFFIVAQLAVAAGARLREILDHDLFDLQWRSVMMRQRCAGSWWTPNASSRTCSAAR